MNSEKSFIARPCYSQIPFCFLNPISGRGLPGCPRSSGRPSPESDPRLAPGKSYQLSRALSAPREAYLARRQQPAAGSGTAAGPQGPARAPRPRPALGPAPSSRTDPAPRPRRPGLRSGGNGQGGASASAEAKAGTLLLPGPAGSSHPGSRRDRGGSGGGGGGGRAGAAARGAYPAVLCAQRAAPEGRRQPRAARSVSPALPGAGHAAPGAGAGAAADFG